MPDGTYILHGVVDPNHVLTESDATNNVTDTLTSDQWQQRDGARPDQPGTTPPTVSMTSPADGVERIRDGSTPGRRVGGLACDGQPVQFLLDGEPLGNADTAAAVQVQLDGGQHLAWFAHARGARVTDSNGRCGHGAAITVNVVASNRARAATTPRRRP